MKRLLFLSLSIMAIASSFADNAVVIDFKDGSSESVFLKDNPILSVQGTYLNMSSDLVSSSWDLSSVADFKVQDLEVTSLSQVNNLSWSYYGNVLSGVVDKEMQISVFDVTGKILYKDIAGEFSVDFNSYVRGSYIVKLGKSNFKVIRK